MKQLLIATAALSLIGAGAFAQTPNPNNPTNNPISDSTAPAGVTKGGAVAAGDPAAPADGSTMSPAASPSTAPTPTPASSDASPPPADPAATSMASAPAADTTASTTTMANNSVGTPPATYPVCTSKHEDRCVNRYQATRMARMNTRHQKTDNVQPSGM